MHIWIEDKMKISIKDQAEIKIMREGGKILGLILHELEKSIIPGMTGLELDAHAEKLMKTHNVLASFKGYKGFPKSICVNVNDQVVHGIPNGYIFKEGDLVTIDCGVIHKDFHTDSAITKGVGVINMAKQNFINTAEKALKKAIETARPGIRIGTISAVIQDTVEKNGYSVIRNLIGHGIGHKLHEDPPVPNFREKDLGPMLQTGMTIAIEPIIAMGNYKVKVLQDGWTIVTKDKSLAAQIEHTIAIGEKSPEILTKRPADL